MSGTTRCLLTIRFCSLSLIIPASHYVPSEVWCPPSIYSCALPWSGGQRDKTEGRRPVNPSICSGYEAVDNADSGRLAITGGRLAAAVTPRPRNLACGPYHRHAQLRFSFVLHTSAKHLYARVVVGFQRVAGSTLDHCCARPTITIAIASVQVIAATTRRRGGLGRQGVCLRDVWGTAFLRLMV